MPSRDFIAAPPIGGTPPDFKVNAANFIPPGRVRMEKPRLVKRGPKESVIEYRFTILPESPQSSPPAGE